MSNPARELHALYARWRQAASVGNKTMAAVVQPMTKGAEEVALAGRLLARIDELLVQLESDGAGVFLYRRQYPGWWTPLLRMNASGAVGAEDVAPSSMQDQIEGFALYLDGKVFELEPIHDESLRTLIHRVRETLEQDRELDETLRQYIHRLLQSIEIALDDDAIGAGFDAAEAIRQLWVALRAAEGASTGSSSVWRDLWTQITAGIVAGGALQAGTVAIGAIGTMT